MGASITTDFTDVAVLKGMRDVLHLSQEDFALLVGMKRQQISGYENHRHTPGLQTVTEMAQRAGLRMTVTIERVGPTDASHP